MSRYTLEVEMMAEPAAGLLDVGVKREERHLRRCFDDYLEGGVIQEIGETERGAGWAGEGRSGEDRDE